MSNAMLLSPADGGVVVLVEEVDVEEDGAGCDVGSNVGVGTSAGPANFLMVGGMAGVCIGLLLGTEGGNCVG
tara:strand:+ start:327 stop:542 length:216 start_codon:yes stop_codon:yes gene_type:complete